MDYEEPAFFEVLRYASRVDRDTIDLVSGNPDWEPPEALRVGLREYARSDSAAFQYPASPGLPGLRSEIAERRGVDRKQVVITNGAGEANYLATAVAIDDGPGTEVIMTDPVYPYYPARVRMLGGDPLFVSTKMDGSLDVTNLTEAVSDDTAAIIINTPNNPTGAVYEEDVIASVIDAARTHDAFVISDETYDHFDYSDTFNSALAVESPHRIVTTSFSKSLAITGFRVGYGVYPPNVVEAAKTRHMLTNVTGSRPAQAAVLNALRETSPAYYAETRAMMANRIKTFTTALDDADVDYTDPDGGFYVMARIPGFDGSMTDVKRLIDETGVAGMPGDAFGTVFQDWIRFALVTPGVEEAADRLARQV